MRYFFILVLSIHGGISLLGQNEASNTPFVQSLEITFEFGSGGGDYGVQAKLNHRWLGTEKWDLISGLGLSSFWGSEAIDAPPSQSSGFTTDNHLRFYSGGRLFLFQKRRGLLSLEGYLGGYHALTKGRFTDTALDIERDYQTGAWIFDYGTRIGLGWQFTSKLGAILTVNNSWKQADSGLGVLAGLFAGEPDGKMSVGVGVNYRWD
ncbi:MAG: hypothetical protein AAFU60_01535 [Bacteroidota bacterium]